jgi:DNA repair exonuclease SbcCD ATPase subunit
MDEIKNTTEAAEQAQSTVAATSVESQTADATTTADAEANTQTDNTESNATEKRPEPTSKCEVVERLKEIVYNGGNVERTELEHLKMLYYRFHNAEVTAARDLFISEGGKAEDFRPAPDMEEENFKAQFSLIRELRNKAAQAVEAEKQANLKRKQEIIERIKELATTPEAADKGYNEVKDLQAEWKEIKQVPAENATELWKNYQLYTEQFYDQLRLNHEMRAYDFKKNLEIKTHLCEAAEKLAEVEDPISAFHQLQKLHQEYREAGPVAKEMREQIWKRFKDASTIINKRHQDHFEQIKAQEEQNLEKKTELCQKVENIDLEPLKTYAQWEEITKQILAYQAEWKTIGFTPRKVNNEIFERFRTACDRFFQAKTTYFKANREKLNANLAAKNALVEKAEALKDSTDWGTTTNKFIELQKQWKTIGAVPHKVSDAIWKRFNDACNYFFDKKTEANAGQRKEEEANLEIKKGIIADLEKLASETTDNMLQTVRDLQTRWNETGHVPYSKKEKIYRRYRELCDKIYDTLHESAGRRRMDNFRKNVADKGGSELTRERSRLQSIFDAKKQEIQTYETNLTFFRSSSKKGNSLVADIEKKVTRLKSDLEEISQKIKAVADQIKAEKESK